MFCGCKKSFFPLQMAVVALGEGRILCSDLFFLHLRLIAVSMTPLFFG